MRRHDDGERRVVAPRGVVPRRGCPRPSRASSARRSLSSRIISACVSGIAEADVVLDELRPVGGQHQPGVEHAAKRRAAPRHRRDRRPDDLGQRPLDRAPASSPAPANRRPCRRCSARCRRRRRACGPAPWRAAGRSSPSREHEEARLLAGEALLDHDRGAGRAVRAGEARRRPRPSPPSTVAATVTPLPAASPSALTTIGAPSRPHVGASPPRVGEAPVARGRDAGLGAERPWCSALEPSSCAAARARPEGGDARRRRDRRRCPATSGASGPTTTRSIAVRPAEGDDRRVIGEIDARRARRARRCRDCRARRRAASGAATARASRRAHARARRSR